MRRRVESVASCSGSFSLFLHPSASSPRRRGDGFLNGCMGKSVCLNNFMTPSREDGSGSQSRNLEGTLLFSQGAYKNEAIININSREHGLLLPYFRGRSHSQASIKRTQCICQRSGAVVDSAVFFLYVQSSVQSTFLDGRGQISAESWY